MRPVSASLRFGSLLVLLLTSACSSLPRPVADENASFALYEARRESLSALDGWSLQGRLAVSDENDGGSGTLRWRQSDGANRLDFHGALGRGAWTLESDKEGARLQMADGRSYQDRSIKDLVRIQLGWFVPVDALSWWVRGLEAPGGIEQRSVGEDGELTELRQAGWVIEFARYREQGGMLLPGKMVARQNDKTVKLAVRNWTLDPVTGRN